MAVNTRVLRKVFKSGINVVQQNKSLLKKVSERNVIHEAALRNFSASSYNLQQGLPKFINTEDCRIKNISQENGTLQVTFEDNTKGVLPFLWLKDNCQCPACFDTVALGRCFLMQNLDTSIQPKDVRLEGNSLKVLWSDGHASQYESTWLYNRSFTPEARSQYRNLYRLQREPWGKDLVLDTFEYNDLKTSDERLLKWLLTMETKGVALMKKTPEDPDAGAQLIDHIAFVKPSHYGRRSPVMVRQNSNNVAFSSIKLGLHNDLPQYYHQPGIIFIQTVKQHVGKGGESTISDGLHGTNILKITNPGAFDLLTKTMVYFWDVGKATFSLEQDSFHKISKAPIIGLDCGGELETLRVNNQIRDSHLDAPPEKVNEFFAAMKLLDDILYEHSYNFKMEDGDILTLDNVRCLHGRESYASSSSRHLESAYLDWDEALCRRRRLLQELGYI